MIRGHPNAAAGRDIRDFQLEAYDFEYPQERVARRPAEPRDSAGLLVLDRRSQALSHERFHALPEYLKAGDCLVLNRTKVWPARLVGKKATGGKAELLLARELEPGRWTALACGFKPGMRIQLDEETHLEVEGRNPDGEYVCRFSTPDVPALMARRGLAPLPPYILKSRKQAGPRALEAPEADLGRYQTVYAREAGSIAAPTAGLHFTPSLLERLKAGGVRVAEIVLHVGRGTFRPVTAPDVRDHRMLGEWYHVPMEALSAVQAALRERGRVVAVGTTAARTLETLARLRGFDRQPPPGGVQGWTDLFIGPRHPFQVVDALITNFHLPRSSPLILAAAFAGRERLLCAYREAVSLGYRLYSYGDAMLIV